MAARPLKPLPPHSGHPALAYTCSRPSRPWRCSQPATRSTSRSTFSALASIATRAATFDLLTNRYLAEAPDATVLHLGCGMDSRVFRIDPPVRSMR